MQEQKSAAVLLLEKDVVEAKAKAASWQAQNRGSVHSLIFALSPHVCVGVLFAGRVTVGLTVLPGLPWQEEADHLKNVIGQSAESTNAALLHLVELKDEARFTPTLTPTNHPRSHPYPNASNYHSPVT